MKRLHSEQGFGIVGTLIIMVAMLSLSVSVAAVAVASRHLGESSYLTSDALQLAEAGADKAVYAINKDGSYSGETSSLGQGSFTTTITSIDSVTKDVVSTGSITFGTHTYTRHVKVRIQTSPSSNSVAFNYAVQVGAGGLKQDNNTSVIGSVYSAGNITGSNGSSISGDAYVSGSSGTIQSPSIGHDAHAHNITSSKVLHDAYYTNISGSTVLGTKHPGSADPSAASFPVTSQNISDWESIASSGGSQGSTNISGTVTMGPKKIDGNLTFSNGAVLNMTGVIWVTGTVTISNSGTIRLDPSMGTKSSVLIADNPSNQATGGAITVGNNGILQGSGNSKSYLTLVSTNSGTTDASPAIHLSNNALNAIFYSTQGEILIDNNSNLGAATGYGLHLSNNASVTYSSGMASSDVQVGPGGSWTVSSWQEY